MVKPVPPEQKAFEQSSGNGGVVCDGKSGDSVEILEKQLSPVESTRANEDETLNTEKKLKRTSRKNRMKSKIPNSMQKVRHVMERLRQDKQKQLEQIQSEIESELQQADRTNPWHDLFSLSKQKIPKKTSKTWIDSTHH